MKYVYSTYYIHVTRDIFYMFSLKKIQRPEDPEAATAAPTEGGKTSLMRERPENVENLHLREFLRSSQPLIDMYDLYMIYDYDTYDIYDICIYMIFDSHNLLRDTMDWNSWHDFSVTSNNLRGADAASPPSSQPTEVG